MTYIQPIIDTTFKTLITSGKTININITGQSMGSNFAQIVISYFIDTYPAYIKNRTLNLQGILFSGPAFMIENNIPTRYPEQFTIIKNNFIEIGTCSNDIQDPIYNAGIRLGLTSLFALLPNQFQLICDSSDPFVLHNLITIYNIIRSYQPIIQYATNANPPETTIYYKTNNKILIKSIK